MEHIYSSLTSIITVVLIVLPTVYRLSHPLIKAKISLEKSRQAHQILLILDGLANAAVVEMDSMVELSGRERKVAAIKFVQKQLGDLSTDVSQIVIGAKVDEAYQRYEKSLMFSVNDEQSRSK